MNISEILRHAHFAEIVFLLIFGQNIRPDTQGDPQDALRRLLGGISEFSGGNWLARSILQRKYIKFIMFFHTP